MDTIARGLTSTIPPVMKKGFKRLIVPAGVALSMKYVNQEIKPTVKQDGNLTRYTWETSGGT